MREWGKRQKIDPRDKGLELGEEAHALETKGDATK